MPNLTDDPAPATGTVLLPLPGFRQPRPPDPPLPEVTDDPAPATEPPANDRPTTSGPLPPPPPADPLPPIDPSREPAPTRTFSAGDIKVAGEVVAGLIALVCGYAAWFLGRRRIAFRQPTTEQLQNVAQPVGAIVARHVPTEFISRDLVDGTRAAGALHAYLTDGPLTYREPEPIPIGDDQ